LPTFLVTYNLHNPNSDYEDVINTLSSTAGTGGFQHDKSALESVVFIKSDRDIDLIGPDVASAFKPGDYWLLVDISLASKDVDLPGPMQKWLDG
jgi:hypothetical protein